MPGILEEIQEAVEAVQVTCDQIQLNQTAIQIPKLDLIIATLAALPVGGGLTTEQAEQLSQIHDMCAEILQNTNPGVV